MAPDVRKTNPTAVAALVSAVLGLSCFWGIGGLVALVLGVSSLKQIDQSEGRQSGKALSITAIALGALSFASLVIAAGVGIAWIVRPPAAPALPTVVVGPLVPAPGKPGGAPSAAGPSGSAPAEVSTPIPGVRETSLGRLRLVDVGGNRGSLTALLDAQRRASRLEGEKLVVFVVVADCLPCNGVSLALPDRRMQAALDQVRLVRVDAGEHSAELLHLGVPVESVPGFALLGEALRPLDYVHGGEWDADVAENMAPVLKAFVRGTYQRRRFPFRGPERRDETPL